MSEMIIRHIKDYENALNLLEYYKNDLPPLNSKTTDLKQMAIKLVNNAIILSCEIEGKSIGFTAFYANNITDREAYISLIAVDQNYRKTGIGSVLLDFIFDDLKKHGLNIVRLEVYKNNNVGITFYEKNGFTYLCDAHENSQYMIKKL